MKCAIGSREQYSEVVTTFDLVDEADPNRITDEVLGAIYWYAGSWEGDLSWDGDQECDLRIEAENREDDVTDQIVLMKRFLAQLRSRLGRISETIADELLETYNEDYTYEDDEIETRDEFLEEIHFIGLSCEPEGNLTCCFDSGELFGDLNIYVLFSSDLSIGSISLSSG